MQLLRRVPGNYRSFIYCTAIRNGGVKEWEFASIQYDKSQQANEKQNLQLGMSCTKQQWLISRYLNDQLNPAKVRLQDAQTGISRMGLTSYGNLITWNFIKENWDFLDSKLIFLKTCIFVVIIQINF